jgi:hypothetical protein
MTGLIGHLEWNFVRLRARVSTATNECTYIGSPRTAPCKALPSIMGVVRHEICERDELE